MHKNIHSVLYEATGKIQTKLPLFCERQNFLLHDSTEGSVPLNIQSFLTVQNAQSHQNYSFHEERHCKLFYNLTKDLKDGCGGHE